MNRIILLMTCTLIIAVCGNANAQTKKKTQTNPPAKTQTVKEEPTQIKDTVANPVAKHSLYKSLTDSSVVTYIIGGFVWKQKLYLTTCQGFDTLSVEKKKSILDKVTKEFPHYDITLCTGGQKRELWVAEGNGVRLLERWNNDSLELNKYMPLELKSRGTMKIFYYVGGSFNGGENYSTGSLNLRAGTYLFKSIVDASVTTNIGYNKSGKESRFAGDIGIDSRAYPPFLRIPKINLSPYAGAGISWLMPPVDYFEFRLLAGAAWFIGPGSLDLGLQYGTKTNFSFTIGYTFRPPFNK